MTGCCVPNCKNSSKKGFIIKRFPKNPARRALWAACISRLNWTPTDNTYICEVHFSDDTWETTRVDGKKKLKLNAISTLFPNYVVKREESLVKEKDQNINKNECVAIDVADDKNNNKDEYEATNVAEDENEHEVMNVVEDENEILTVVRKDQNKNKTECEAMDVADKNENEDEYEATNVAEDENKHEVMNVIEDENEILTVAVSQNVQDKNNTNSNILLKKYQRLIKAHKVMKNKLRQQQAKSKKLEKKLKDDKNRKMLEKVFNSDQIEFLERDGKKIKIWSAVTIKKALKLRFTCGNNSYEELIKQNIPLPCLRTLRKRLEHVQFHNKIDDKIFEYLKLKVDGFKDNDKECMLVLDEMAIMPGTSYDVSSHTMIGNTTLPNNTDN